MALISKLLSNLKKKLMDTPFWAHFGPFLQYLTNFHEIWYSGVIFGADFKNFVKFEKKLLGTPFWAHFGPFLQYLTNFYEIWYSGVIFGADLKLYSFCETSQNKHMCAKKYNYFLNYPCANNGLFNTSTNMVVSRSMTR